jgi:hypothetical protein
MDFSCGRVARNIGILPVSSNGHPAWSAMNRLGSLRDASGSPQRIRPVADWKPKLLQAMSDKERESTCERADER